MASDHKHSWWLVRGETFRCDTCEQEINVDTLLAEAARLHAEALRMTAHVDRVAEVERLRAEVDGQQATIERLLVRNGEMREIVRAVAGASHRLSACGQASIDYLDIPHPGKLQEQARALLAAQLAAPVVDAESQE